jgi:hypothetical protein
MVEELDAGAARRSRQVDADGARPLQGVRLEDAPDRGRLEATSLLPLHVAELDAYVEAEILAWAEPVADEPVVLDELRFEATLEERRGELERTLAAVELALDGWVEGTAATGLDAARVYRGTSARLAAIEQARAELEAFDAANVETAERSIVRTSLRQAWPELDALERRELLAAVLEAVVVGRGPVVGSRASSTTPIAERVELRFITAP